MSFSAQVKDEVARLELQNDCCRRSELAALARVVGTILLGQEKRQLVLTTEASTVARRIFRLVKALGWDGVITVRRYARPRRHRLFAVRAYHLELVLKTVQGVEEVAAALSAFGLRSGIRERKEAYRIYLKDAEQVVEFLRVIGANQAVLYFENCRVLKEMKNQINRLVNCETANLGKTVETGLKQVAMIKEIEALAGLGALRPQLRELALLRLRHPEASLSELGRLLMPPLGKSGVSHRFREMQRFAEQLRKRQGNPGS
jgi:DNA-binding transcriptional regulator WhiA